MKKVENSCLKSQGGVKYGRGIVKILIKTKCMEHAKYRIFCDYDIQVMCLSKVPFNIQMY